MVIDEVPTGRLVLENQELIAEDRAVSHAPAPDEPRTILVGLVLDQYGGCWPACAVDLRCGRSRREPGPHDAVLNEIEDVIEDLDDDVVLMTSASASRAHGRPPRAQAVRDRRPIIEVQITRLGREALKASSTRSSRSDDRPPQSCGDRRARPAAAAGQYRTCSGHGCRRRSRSLPW
jgi:hypothetical protein